MGNYQEKGGNFADTHNAFKPVEVMNKVRDVREVRVSFKEDKNKRNKENYKKRNRYDNYKNKQEVDSIHYSIETEPAVQPVAYRDNKGTIKAKTAIISLGSSEFPLSSRDVHISPKGILKCSPRISNPQKYLPVYAPKTYNEISNPKSESPISYRESSAFGPSIIPISSNTDEILYQGTLLKYKPGLKTNWIERWCVLTRSEFKYYRDEFVAICPDLYPLLTVPIKEIIHANRISLDLPKNQIIYKNQNKETTPYQFEIFKRIGGHNYLEKSHIQQNSSYQYPLSGNYPEKSENIHKRNRSSDNRILSNFFNMPKKQSSHSRSRSIAPLRLNSTREYTLHKNSPRTANKTPDQSSMRLSRTYKEAFSALNKSSSNRQSRVQGYLSNPSKIKNEPVSWTRREKELQISETRLIFGCYSQDERDKWIGVLNWVLNEPNVGYR